MPVSVRPAIARLPAYRAGKAAPPGPNGVSYKLSSNENPHPPLPGVLEAATKAADDFNRYPDFGNTRLTEAVAEHLAMPAESLAFGTGAVGVLYHLLQALCGPGDEVIYAWRSFEAYPIAVEIAGARPVAVPLGPGAVHDLGAMAEAVTPATKVVLLCTPNNPTGPTIGHQELLDFVATVRDDVAIIIDEAYLHFVTDKLAARGLEILAEHPNVISLRTFSKAYGLAGLRVGFCVANPEIASAIRATALPFGVSALAQAAAVASLVAEPALLQRVEEIVGERERLIDELTDLGFDLPAAQGNFVWLPAGPRTQEWTELFTAAGLMVRPFAAGTPEDGLRISIGEPDANTLVAAVAATLPRDR